ncbi:unnamed protein product [Calypogeia fissa]
MLQFCQPLVALDACHTKNRKYPTQVFLATAIDGNSNIVILCYAVAPTETKESWVWFLRLMRKSLHGIDDSWIPLISDRAKGLLPAVEEVFPGKIHAYFSVHLRGNVKVKFGKAAAQYLLYWVLVDGEGSAKVQTQDMQEEYLVTLNPTPTCSCWELQEMCWPCQHIMAWDDHQGRDYTHHFHICWKIESLQAMYQGRLPPFLSEDLDMSLTCMPPPIAVKKGRHRIVCIPSGGGSVQNQQVGEDEFVDADGHLYRRYPIEDNPSLQDPMPRPTPNTAEFVPEELGGEQYSSGEEDNVGDDSLHLREIIGGKFGTTQEPQNPEWQAFNLTNWEGLSQVQDHLEGRWRPRSPESVSDFASTDWEF